MTPGPPLKFAGASTQSRAEACTPYTEYRGPGLRGAREGPLYSVIFFQITRKEWEEKKEKNILLKKQKMFYICLNPLENFRG